MIVDDQKINFSFVKCLFADFFVYIEKEVISIPGPLIFAIGIVNKFNPPPLDCRGFTPGRAFFL